MNGLSNVTVLRAAAEAGVPRIVLVNATCPNWGLIQGYREGKEMAEAAAKLYPETSGLGPEGCSVLVLKPGAIAGTKYVGKAGNVPIPLGLMMAPMRFIFRVLSGPCRWLESLLPGVLGNVLRPAVLVEEMAAAAADSILAEKPTGLKVLDTDTLVGYKSIA
eukprot:SRR837773.9126.p2 GENE.SRR837773.9126~~SRR837773.9126.p2  ORF type:complete len:176 (+),score=72.64 SRR837773.9126:43-528(+)